MYIFPYCKPTQIAKRFDTGAQWVLWCFLTEGGHALWKTDEDLLSSEDVVRDYCIPNGFVGRVTGVEKNTVFFEVDPKKTNFNDFYLWTEFLAKGQEPPLTSDLWIPFYWVGDASKAPGGEDEWRWMAQTESQSIKGWGSLKTMWQVLRDLTIPS
jgi:hypothetical protein